MSDEFETEADRGALDQTGTAQQESLIMQIDCSRSISPREASLMLEWATECSDPQRATELLRVFKALGGLQIFNETISEIDEDETSRERGH